MDYKEGDIVRFEWQLLAQDPVMVLVGEVVSVETEKYIIKVVDSNNQTHRFHCLPRQVIGLAD